VIVVDFFNRVIHQQAPDPQPPERLDADKIDAGYRLFWTKQALGWDADRRAVMAIAVADVVAGPSFEANALERRFMVTGLDASAHSGASLLALVEVLRALDAFDAE
jgi:hypothetical protein